jgi:hypothetical protein
MRGAAELLLPNFLASRLFKELTAPARSHEGIYLFQQTFGNGNVSACS